MTRLHIVGFAANNTTMLVSQFQTCAEGGGCARTFRYRTCFKEKSWGRFIGRKRERNQRESRHDDDRLLSNNQVTPT
jgi:hypothetical protein